MKMRNLLLGVILGLLAAVHATPDNTVTQNPAKPDEAFLKDAMTEGFIIGPPPTLTTESPKINNTVQASQQPVPISEDMTEGSAAGENNDMPATSISPYATTPLSISHAQTSEATESYMFESSGLGETNDEPVTPFALDPTTTLSVSYALTSDSTESYVLEGSVDESTTPFTLDTTSLSVSHTQTSDFTESYGFEESASEEPSAFVHMTTTSVPSEVWSSNYNVISQTSDFQSILSSGTGPIQGVRKFVPLGRDGDLQPQTETHTQTQTYEQKMQNTMEQKGHNTPDWIIIVGFIVGVAALVMLFAAIATRHKWNQPYQTETKTKQEMETFLPNGKPKENGNSGEYTVIPLEDVPENNPSQ